MRMHDKCLPCVVNQAIKVANITGINTKEELLREVFAFQEYRGIDLSPANISVFQSLIIEKGYNNVKAEVGDATDLCNVKDNSFDVVYKLWRNVKWQM